MAIFSKKNAGYWIVGCIISLVFPAYQIIEVSSIISLVKVSKIDDDMKENFDDYANYCRECDVCFIDMHMGCDF